MSAVLGAFVQYLITFILLVAAAAGGSNPSAPTGVFPVIHFCGCRDFLKGV